MNIFFVEKYPIASAIALCDKHVVKMIVETAQLLSTAHHVLDGPESITGLYKQTHKNHPSAIWARECNRNYNWLYRHGRGLCAEYWFRYGKIHKTETLMITLKQLPQNITETNKMTPPPLCMPEEFKINYSLDPHENAIASYRNYYRTGKKHLHIWTKRQKPVWL